MRRSQSSRRRRAGARALALTVRPRIEVLEDRTLLSNGEWLTVIEGITPGETLEQQAQNGQDLMLASGVAYEDAHVISAFDLSGSFLVQTPLNIDKATLFAELQIVPGFAFLQEYPADDGGGEPGDAPPVDGESGPEPIVDDPVVNDNSGSTGTSHFTQSNSSLVAFGSSVVVAYTDSGSAAGGANKFTGFARSSDGGATFTDGGALPTSANGDGGSPSLARNNNGVLFLATTQATGSGINVFRSTDSGVTWSAPVQGAPVKSGPQDRPWITVDNVGGIGSGAVYLVERDNGPGNGIFLYRSLDGGLTFGPNGGTFITAGASVQNPTVVVGQDHAVYVFYWSGTSLHMRKSTNQGLSFSTFATVATLVSAGGASGDLGLTGRRNGDAAFSPFRTNKTPMVAANLVNDHLYAVYNDDVAGSDKADIKFTMSTNGGLNWSTPARVNDDATLTDQWAPSIAVTPDGTKVGIFYYSRQEDPTANNLFKEYGRVGAVSGSSVAFAPSFAVSDVASTPEFGRDSAIAAATFMVDYTQAVATANTFHVGFSDIRSPLPGGGTRMDPNVFYAKIALPLGVRSTFPDAGATVTTPLTSFNVNVTEPINPASLQASDFKVNNVAATSVTYTAGGTLITFGFATSPMTTQGPQTMHIDAGAFTRASDGSPVSQFDAIIFFNVTTLAVSSTNPPFPNGVFTLPAPFTYDVSFNEAVDPSTVQTSDLTLGGITGATVTGVTMLPGNTTARFTLDGVTVEGVLTVNIAADAFTDAFGNPGSNAFSANYVVDVATVAFPTTPTPANPLGSLIYDNTASGRINIPADTDSFTLAMDAGQTITVLVAPTVTGLRPIVELYGPDGAFLGSATAPANGAKALLQTAPAAPSGAYTISVKAVGSTSGAYNVQVILNAALEAEAHGGPANNTRDTAQDLGASFVPLQTPQAGADRGGAVGQFLGGDDDFYSVNLSAGQSLTAGLVAINAPQNLFGPRTDYTGYSNPQDVTYGDFNGDGRLDMAVANFGPNPPGPNPPTPRTVAVRLNTGGGTFGQLTNYTVGAQPSSLAVGDIDADGKVDLVCSNFGSGTVSLLRGKGDGTFFSAVHYAMSGQPSGIQDVVLADFNGDGRGDVAVANSNENSVWVRLGQSDGTLGAPLVRTGSSRAFSLAAGDLNHDGHLDLVTTNPNTTSGLMLGNGDGTFTTPVTLTGTQFPRDVGLGDFNGDGHLDIVGVNGTPTLGLRLGNGDGTFGAQIFMAAGVISPGRLAVADINGDGKTDLAITTDSSPPEVSVLLGTGNATFLTPIVLTTPADPRGVALADVTGDGLPDLTTTSATANSVSVFLNTPINVQLQLIDGDGNVLQSGASTPNLNTALSFVAPTADTYFLRIAGTGSGVYNLVLTRDAAFDTEGNHTFGAAQDITGNSGVLGYVGVAAEDWYSITVAGTGSSIRLETSTPADGSGQFVNNLNPHVELYDPSGTLIHSGSAMADGRNEFLQSPPLAAGTYRVRITPEGTTKGEYFLSKNLSPSVTVDVTSPINENESATMTGTISDDGYDSHMVVITWGPGEGSTTLTLEAGVISFSASHLYLDDNPSVTSFDTYPIGVTVTDSQGVAGAASSAVLINNVAPAVDPITGPVPGPGVRGQTLSFASRFTDMGALDTHQATWNFGDGTGDFGPVSAIQDTTISADHVFTASGMYTVTLTIEDDDGGVTVVTKVVTIADLALQDDPSNPGQTMLVVGGTTGDDTIQFSPGGNTGAISLTINGTYQGDFSPTSRFLVYAQDGNDDVQVAGGIDLAAWLFGGDGDDRLNGGAGNNVLDGGDGNDLLLGGNGRDLMIGGNGADHLVGNGADDILIGGRTLLDDHALGAVMAEWASARDHATRIANLRGLGTGPRLNGNTFLTMEGPSATVVDDGVSDTLTGASGLDWFLAHQDDVVTDRHSWEEEV